jgi:hypothetical protein
LSTTTLLSVPMPTNESKLSKAWTESSGTPEPAAAAEPAPGPVPAGGAPTRPEPERVQLHRETGDEPRFG